MRWEPWSLWRRSSHWPIGPGRSLCLGGVGDLLTDFVSVRPALGGVHGDEPGETILPAVTDCRFYGRYYGIPSLSYGATGSGSHGFDEWVDLASIKTVTLTIASFIAHATRCAVQSLS